MTDVTAIVLGYKTEGAMFTSQEEYDAVMHDVDKRVEEICHTIDADSIVEGETRTTDIDLGRCVGSVYRLGADGHIEKAPASAVRLELTLRPNDGLTITDAYPALSESDAGKFEATEETFEIMNSSEWIRLAETDDAAATVAISRAIPGVPVLTDPGNGDPAYIPYAEGRYECSRLGYHAVNLTVDETHEVWEIAFPLMVALAAVNGCVFDVREPGPEFDEWERWREEATAHEQTKH